MSTLVRMSAALVLATIVSGCLIGQRAGNFRPAQGPSGVGIELRLRPRGTVRGELLAVEDTALLVLQADAAHPPRIVRVPLRVIRWALFAQMGDLISNGRFQSAEALRRARIVSRYPQGTLPELLEGLLRAYEQPQVETPAS